MTSDTIAGLRNQVMWNRLISVVEEQALTLVRTAFSTSVRESGDLSAGVFNQAGEMIAQAVTGTPGHVNAMAAAVGHFIAEFGPDRMFEGDVYITNDPWRGTGHLHDITVVSPAFRGGRPIGFFACTAHVVDIGGRGFGPDAAAVYEEGLFIPIMKLAERGVVNRDLVNIVRHNVREADQVVGDIHSLAACNEIGQRRLADMMDEFGIPDLESLAAFVFARSHDATLAVLAALPPGTYRNAMRVDGYGDPVDLVVALEVGADGIVADFAGTSGQSPLGINVPLIYTTAYAVYGLKCALAPEVPNNAASLRPFRVTAPPGCILNALHPAPVAVRHVLGHFIPDAILGALHAMLPAVAPAEGSGALWNIHISARPTDGRPPDGLALHRSEILMFNSGGGGARPALDGLNATAFPSGVHSVSVEATEHVGPVIVWRKELREGSGGAGAFRGGLGQVVEIAPLAGHEFHFNAMFDRVDNPAGGPGHPGRRHGDAGEGAAVRPGRPPPGAGASRRRGLRPPVRPRPRAGRQRRGERVRPSRPPGNAAGAAMTGGEHPLVMGSEHPLDAFTLDDRSRGVPPGQGAFSSRDISTHGWSPADGRMALPLVSVDLPALDANRSAMMGIARHFGVGIAPHAKTPMAPALARAMMDAGAWGTSVADLRQASVMLHAGLRRLVIANQVGGAGAGRRLAQLLSGFRDAEVSVFVDSVPAVSALAEAWGGRDDVPPLGLLLEVGRGRAGVRTLAGAAAVLDALPGTGGRLRFDGVACYESTALTVDEAVTMAELRAIFDLAAGAMRLVRSRVGGEPQLVLTAGSSSLFDLVIELGLPIVQADGRATLLLRCGALFFGDHGNTQARLDALVARGRLDGALDGGRNPFRPAVRLWAELLSRPQDGLAICGLGLRDTSHDQGLPVPLRLWRDGQPVVGLDEGTVVAKLNDQHAFVTLAAGLDARVGDVLEFGIRHPCTCLDKHDVLYGLDGQGTVAAAFRTFFG